MADRDGDHDRRGDIVGSFDQHRADEVGDDTDDRADREVDVPGQHDERLPDGHDRDDGHAGADAGERPGREVVRDLGREEHGDRDDDQDEDQLAELLRADVPQHGCIMAAARGRRLGRSCRSGRASWPIAAARTRSWVASARSRIAICRPSRMTRMRSLVASTSGRSELIRMMADPFVRPARRSSGGPRPSSADVDAARRLVEDRARGAGCSSHLLSTTFCWLPPDSVATGTRTDAARIVSRSRNASAVALLGVLPDEAQPVEVARRASAARCWRRSTSGRPGPASRRSSVV